MSEKVGMAQWYGYPIFTPLPQGSTRQVPANVLAVLFSPQLVLGF